jgi:hypothetical protein
MLQASPVQFPSSYFNQLKCTHLSKASNISTTKEFFQKPKNIHAVGDFGSLLTF